MSKPFSTLNGSFTLREEEAIPSLVADGEPYSIQCGHCVAVCPHGAMIHKTMGPEDCPPVHKELLLSPQHMEQFLRYRRSIRVYKEKEV